MVLAEIDFWDLIWFLVLLYVIVGYGIALVVMITDLLHSTDLSGAAKALWLVSWLVLPILSVVAYLFIRGDGFGERREARARASRDAAGQALMPPPPPQAPAAEITAAKALLDSGTISQAEFDAIKARALG